MKYAIQIFIALLTSIITNAQSEDDSLFFFDHLMNCSSEDEANWVARKIQDLDSITFVKTEKTDTNRFLKAGINDKYIAISNKEMIVLRSFTKRDQLLPGEYEININIKDTVDGLYKMDLFSRGLNIHRTVLSKTLIPICPVEKTIYYHPNDSIAEIDYHNSKSDSNWNARGEFIDHFHIEVDSMPVIANYSDYPFDIALSRYFTENIKYPKEASNAFIQGRVFLSFIVTDYGNIERVKILRSIHPLIDNAAIEVIEKIKIEKPPFKDGEAVNQIIRIPVSFNM